MSNYTVNEMEDFDPDEIDEIEAMREEQHEAAYHDDPDNECQCERAVKIKDGGQVCQVCGLDAYNSQYVFAHTEKGIALLRAAGKLEPHHFVGATVTVKVPPPVIDMVPVFVDDEVLDEAMNTGEFGSVAEAEAALAAPPLILTAPSPVAPVMPPELPTGRARKPKAPKAPKAPKVAKVKPPLNPLLVAVEFIALAQRSKLDEEAPMLNYCSIAYGGITAFDRVIAAGTRVREDDLMCFAYTDKLLLALSKCGMDYKLVQLDQQLFVSSGDFQAYVPLTSGEKIVTAVPDPYIAPLNEKFRDACKTVGRMIKDSAPTLLQSAAQLNNGSIIATNGQVILEVWHGSEFPPNRMLIPKRFCDMLGKADKEIKGFGYSATTFTVWFTDESWLRTNLFQGKLEIDLTANIDVLSYHKKNVPASFFGMVEEVAKWSDDQRIHFYEGRISSHSKDKQNVGSARIFSFEGFNNNRIYSSIALKSISKFCTSIDDESVPNMTLFFGETTRGAIMHEVPRERPVLRKAPEGWRFCSACNQPSFNEAYSACCNPECAQYNQVTIHDDDIPF